MKKQNLRASGGVTDTQRARVRFMASAIIQPDPLTFKFYRYVEQGVYELNWGNNEKP
jgi:hypothetical protein